MVPQQGLLPLWQTTVISPVWKQKGTPSDPTTYQGLPVLHLLGKLFAVNYLSHLDNETHSRHWLAEGQAGVHLGHRIEGHQLLLTYLLLAASCHQGPLALAFIDLEKAYDRAPRFTFWQVLAEELEVLADIRTGIELLYN